MVRKLKTNTCETGSEQVTQCLCIIPTDQHAMHLTSDNIRYHASYLHSSVDIQDRVIHFGPGALHDKLLEIPIGQFDFHATIVITVGLVKSHLNTPTNWYLGRYQ